MSARLQILSFLIQPENSEQEFPQAYFVDYTGKNKSSVSRAITKLQSDQDILVRKETVGTTHTKYIKLNPDKPSTPTPVPRPAKPSLNDLPKAVTAAESRMSDKLTPAPPDIQPIPIEHVRIAPELLQGIQQLTATVGNMESRIENFIADTKLALDPVAYESQADRINSDMLRHIIYDLSGVRTRYITIEHMKDLIKRFLDDSTLDVAQINLEHRHILQKSR